MRSTGQSAANALVVLLLATMPFWMQYVGGYTELATQVLVMALIRGLALHLLLGCLAADKLSNVGESPLLDIDDVLLT